MKHWFMEASDGIRLAVLEMGEGRPLILIHGFVSDAATNWIKYGHAALLAEAGFRVIVPDLRAHGDSAKPHEPVHYPADILADDQFALLNELGVEDFDLGGYSLGGRTVSRMLARGCRPRRAIIAGMGLEGLTHTGKRKTHFRSVFENLDGHVRGSPEFMAAAFVKTTGADPVALNLLLDSFVDTPEEAIRGFDLPIAVVCGEQDDDNGSAAALVDALPQGRHYSIPGNHMSAVVKPELGQAIADFLQEGI